MSTETAGMRLSQWRPLPETTCIADDAYANLEAVDISCFISDTCHGSFDYSRREVVNRAMHGFKNEGFIVLTGHGLDAQMISRQFDLGKMFLDEVSEEEKHRYHAKIEEEGSWAGYKPLGYYKRPNGSRDSTEFHDFYPDTVTNDQQPPLSWPYLSEIEKFYAHNHFVMLRAVLRIISEGLELPSDSLWNLHHRQGYTTEDNGHIQTKDLLRSAMYYPPLEEDREKNKWLWLPPHTDRGSVTFLYPQPIAGLQVFVDGQWKYVRHYQEGILVNIGDALEFTTGRLLKAALHRVSEPPSDQRHIRRLGLFYFATMLPEIPLRPIEAIAARAQPSSDVFDEFENINGRVPTAEEWQIRRAKVTGKAADLILFKKRFPTQDIPGSVNTLKS